MNHAAYMARYLARVGFIARMALCVLALTLVSQAQEPTHGLETEVDRIAGAEKVLHPGFLRDQLGLALKAEHQLKLILRTNPTTPYCDRVQEDLKQVQEILANHNLLIASFYMRKVGTPGITGAESRLLQITVKYRQFSKMDEVLLRLGACRPRRAAR